MSEPSHCPPRIPPLPESERTDDHEHVVRLLGLDQPRNSGSSAPWDSSKMPDPIWREILLRHPSLVTVWWPLTQYFISDCSVPLRQRELAVLRTTWVCRGQFQWKAHTVMAQGLGVSVEEIERVRTDPNESDWSTLDRAVLQAVDELHAESCISDTTWATLADHWDEQQLIEFPFLVGQYSMFSFALNSLGVAVSGWDAPVE